MSEYRKRVAIPYLSALIENIKRRFTDIVVKLLVASSIFCPAKLPPKDQLGSYGCYEIELLSNFYGRAASVEYEGATYKSPPLINAEDLVSEWKVYRRAMLQEKERLIAFKGNVEIPSIQDVAATTMSCTSYADIFPETFKVIQILLTLPVGTATVERSFSQMKMIKLDLEVA